MQRYGWCQVGKGSRIPASYGPAFKRQADRQGFPPESPRFRHPVETEEYSESWDAGFRAYLTLGPEGLGVEFEPESSAPSR